VIKFVITGMFFLIVLSACSTKKSNVSEYEYQRSNAASQKAIDKLDRE